MVYIRVVLAVDNVELEQDGFNFEDRLTVFIEEDDAIGQVKAVSESAAVAASFYAQGGELRQLMYGVVTASSEPKVWASDMEWYDDADHLPDGSIYRLIATCEVNTLDLEVEVFDA
jgi:hypothetical protein